MILPAIPPVLIRRGRGGGPEHFRNNRARAAYGLDEGFSPRFTRTTGEPR